MALYCISARLGACGDFRIPLRSHSPQLAVLLFGASTPLAKAMLRDLSLVLLTPPSSIELTMHECKAGVCWSLRNGSSWPSATVVVRPEAASDISHAFEAACAHNRELSCISPTARPVGNLWSARTSP